jgi:hypothetical protein
LQSLIDFARHYLAITKKLTKEEGAAKSSPKLRKENTPPRTTVQDNQNSDRPRALCPASQIVVVVAAILVW